MDGSGVEARYIEAERLASAPENAFAGAKLFESGQQSLLSSRFDSRNSIPTAFPPAQALLPESAPERSVLGVRASIRAETRGGFFSLPESDKAGPPRNWTVAVSLTTDLAGESGESSGAQNKFRQVRSLVDLTRESPVTLYVQLPEEAATASTSGNSPAGKPIITTYRIENGQMTAVERAQSRGVAADLESLLGRASRRADSGNLGLIIQSHGAAERGISGDTGRANLSELESSIRTGLSRGGRSSLDLLNFDSCLMSNTSVLSAMQGEATNIVASAQTETAVNGADGQNLAASLGNLIRNPAMKPSEFADSFVTMARQGKNDDRGNERTEESGTDTLASVNVPAYRAFESSLNTLSETLLQAASDPISRAAITRAFNDTKSFGTASLAAPDLQRKDAGLLLNNLELALNQGSLSDSNGDIRRSIQETRASLRELVRDYHGENYRQYSEMAGLSLPVPNAEMLNLRAIARANSPAGQISSLLQTEMVDRKFEQKAESVMLIGSVLGQLGDCDQSRALMQALEQLKSADSLPAYLQALAEMQKAVNAYELAPAGEAQIEQAVKEMRQENSRLLASGERRLPRGWRSLIESLTLRDG